MIDRQTHTILQDLFLRQTRSLLRYVSESFPWIAQDEQDAAGRLQQMVDEETECCAQLARFMTRHRVVPPLLGSYPSAFTNINYVSLDHLVPLLTDDARHEIAHAETALAQVSAECRPAVEAVLAMKRRHLQALEEIERGLEKGQAVAS
jgi:hypothetical protein